MIAKTFREAGLKNKIFFSSLTVILLLSFIIALFTRWIVISSLTTELKLRGRGVAYSIADSSRSFMLTENVPELTSLIFEARLGHRKSLIAYIFVVGKNRQILAHTFTDAFPQGLESANPITPESAYSTRLVKIGKRSAYDIAVPIKEGIYQIGTVHVGLKKEHIDQLISKLRNTFVGFLSAITVFFFVISHILSRYITRPISKLTEISNQICQGNLDVAFGLEDKAEPLNRNPNGRKDGWETFGNQGSPGKGPTGKLTSGMLDGKSTEFADAVLACEIPNNYPGDEVSQLALAFNNMTVQLKRSQQELRESEGKYRSLFDSGPIPIFVLDRETLEIIDANPSAEEAYGYHRKEILGKAFTNFGRFEFEGRSLLEISQKGWPEGFILTENVRYYRQTDKKPLYVRVRACPADYKGRKTLIMAATDITEMMEKDAQLIQASKMSTLGEMSAGVAHELNQPLNAIKIGNEYLKMMTQEKKTIPEENLLQVVSEVSEQVDRASEIINRLREFGRKTDFTKEKVYINIPVKAVLGMVGQQLRLENIQVKLELADSLPPIMAHNNRLEQVLFNLITNARDAINSKTASISTLQKHAIRIQTFREGPRVVVSVTDSGIGIPKGILDRIFEPFFTTKEVGHGMGLGLSIIYGIVRDYGGNIEIDSEEGQGATFTLSFPAVLT